MNGQDRIDTVYAFIAVDSDGTERIIAAQTAIGALPLIGADLDRIASLREAAQAAAREDGIEVKLVHFTARTEIETIKPS